jgi:glycosyltransferase involved in cell wall biosynthesis
MPASYRISRVTICPGVSAFTRSRPEWPMFRTFVRALAFRLRVLGEPMAAFTMFHAFVVAILAALGVQTILNARAMRRLSAPSSPSTWPTVSVLIPVRNEASRIAACVAAWRVQDYPNYEVVIYDDDSSDRTRPHVEHAAAGAANIRVIVGARLPAGWRGKTHACHRLRESARGDILVFADADVEPRPSALAAAVATLGAVGGHACSALPSHAPLSPLLRAIVGLQNWAAMSVAPIWLPAARRRRTFAMLNGQFIVIAAAVYDAAGGFSAVKESLAEDTAFGRRLVALGYRVELVDGSQRLTCRSYARLADLWRANVRNLAAVLFGSPWLLLGSAVVLGTVYIAPLALLGLGPVFGRAGSLAWTWLPAAEIALAIGARAVVDHRSGHGVWVAALHPLAIASLIAMQCDALTRMRRGGEVEWRDRRYRVTDEVA